MKKILLSLLLFCSFTSANASLLGDTVHIAQNYPVLGSEFFPVDAVVGAGNEFVWPGVVSIDVGASTIDIVFGSVSFVPIPSGPQDQNGPIISGLNDSSGAPLLGFQDFFTNTEFTADRIFFSNDTIGFNFGGLNFISGQTLHVALNFGNQQADVPEPGMLAMLGIGLIGLISVRRRRQ